MFYSKLIFLIFFVLFSIPKMGTSQKANSKKTARIILRSKPRVLARANVYSMIIGKGFYDRSIRQSGDGIDNNYELKNISGDLIVIDHTTGLIWQQSGSDLPLWYDEAKNYVVKLNRNKFAGFSDWRLPTLEEAASLLEPTSNLNINKIFDSHQGSIWSSDLDAEDGKMAWFVDFMYGPSCNHSWMKKLENAAVRQRRIISVRAVRSIK